MSIRRAKILIILVSGSALTYGSSKKRQVQHERELGPWMREMQELSIMAEIDATLIAHGKESGVSPELWQNISQTIEAKYHAFDGFVISHEVETLHYTAPAIGAALPKVGKPVVLTASLHDLLRPQVPAHIRALFAHARGLGQKDNLLNALHVAESDMGEVCAVFGNQIHRAIELTPQANPDAQYFRSLSGVLLGKVDFGLKLFPPIRRIGGRAPLFHTSFAPDIAVIDLHPGANLATMLTPALEKTSGVIVKMDPASRFNAAQLNALEELQKKVPLLIYQPEAKSEKIGAIPVLHSLPYHTAFVLSSWMFSQASQPAKLRALIKAKYKEILH